ncbi:MAG: response regulator transcription factor [Gemmatimonadota bacterium]|nr:response regulator transcription factor [Gemmatimonadota bacterium]
MRVLLVEDDPTLAGAVVAYLRGAGFAVDSVSTGGEALLESAVIAYDAIVLDLGLPDLDGVEVCRQLRERAHAPRILMATARDALKDRVTGLETGADDYIVKPYALVELTARLRALMRRPVDAIPPVLVVADLSLDTGTQVAHRGERAIRLTAKEFAVLEYLMRNEGRVVSRAQISEHAWDENYDAASNVIEVYVARLRRKLDEGGEAPLLHTVRGSGYRLGPQP